MKRWQIKTCKGKKTKGKRKWKILPLNRFQMENQHRGWWYCLLPSIRAVLWLELRKSKLSRLVWKDKHLEFLGLMPYWRFNSYAISEWAWLTSASVGILKSFQGYPSTDPWQTGAVCWKPQPVSIPRAGPSENPTCSTSRYEEISRELCKDAAWDRIHIVHSIVVSDS